MLASAYPLECDGAISRDEVDCLAANISYAAGMDQSIATSVLQLTVASLFFGALIGVPFWGRRLALRPLYRASNAQRESMRYLLPDLTVLVCQLAMTYGILLETGMRDSHWLRPTLLLLFTSTLLAGLWMQGIRILEGACIRSFFARAVFLLLAQPLAVFAFSIAIGSSVGLIYYLPDLPDIALAKLAEIDAIRFSILAIACLTSVALLAICNLLARWVATAAR